jgi:hypothetical protein
MVTEVYSIGKAKDPRPDWACPFVAQSGFGEFSVLGRCRRGDWKLGDWGSLFFFDDPAGNAWIVQLKPTIR